MAIAAVVGIVLVAPAAALIAVVVAVDDAPTGVEQPATPFVITPSEQADLGLRNATTTVVFNEAESLLASGGDGRITEIHIEPGTTLETGDPVYTVNGITRIADAPPTPYYRPLSLRAAGPDVEALHVLLSTRGYDVDITSDTYSSATQSAVRNLRSSLGEERPSANFTPDLVVWIPTPTVAIDEVLITTDQPAPAQGIAIAKLSPTIESATLELANGTAIPETLQLGPITDVRTNIEIGQLTDTTTGSVTLNADGQRVAFADLRTTDEAGTAIKLDTTIEQSAAQTKLVVAATAITTTASGDTACVWRRNGANWIATSVDVAPAAQPGSVAITNSDIDLNTELLANPTDILTTTTCPSNS